MQSKQILAFILLFFLLFISGCAREVTPDVSVSASGGDSIEEQTNTKDSSSTASQDDSHFTETEKENTDLPTVSQNESNSTETKKENATSPTSSQNESKSAETGEESPNSVILTVVRKIDLQDDTTQLTGEPAEDLLSMLNGLIYDKETCDGIPEYTVICQDQTRYDLNLTSGWVWRAEKECKLSQDMIEKLSAMLFN